ncbi:MAG: hydantoinase B/oxoprolinase family protein [Rhodospirillales bacterium]|jgi:N-methylhydantoinase B|nr:hydantoinase B/oxoprolinase family protein [Rhodospirillales bacterium]
MKLDPILLEILNTKVSAAADEMYYTLKRASRSIYVKEAADFATAILDVDGQLFAHPPSATFNFLIDTNYADTIRAVPDVAPGDVIFTNDPYFSNGLSTHLPDLHMIRPYFHRGRVVAYGWCFVHCTDIGGAVPSSIAPSLHEIFQEGLRVPPMKLIKKGVPNEDLFNLVMANNRTPDVNMGDIKAMLGSLETGAQRVADIIERHGVDDFLTGQKDLQDYSADKARDVLRRIPDGTYEFWDFMDDDMVSAIPLRMRVKLEVLDGRLNIDLTDTDPQVAASYNVPTMGGRNYWITFRLTSFLTTYDQSMAKNAGLYRSITVTNPPGTVMNAEFPDAVGNRAAPGRRVADAINGAVLKAQPGLLPAPSGGISTPFALAEFEADGAKRTVQVIEPMRGGMGALDGQDGVDARDNSMNNMQNHPLETVEADSGVIIRQYDLRPDSGGPGRWRGGVGQVITTEILRDGSTVLARGMERLRFPSFGVFGGKPGRPVRAFLNRGLAGERELSKIDQLAVKAGDRITFLMPGGGGYGDPYLRDPAKVLSDVELGFVSPGAAARDYGVVVKGGAVGAAATKKLRQGRVKENLRADFDFGPERDAWEAVFDDATVSKLNRALYAMPKSVRQSLRRRIFEHAVGDLPVAGGGRTLASVMADPDAIRARLAEVMNEIFGAEEERALAAK